MIEHHKPLAIPRSWHVDTPSQKAAGENSISVSCPGYTYDVFYSQSDPYY